METVKIAEYAEREAKYTFVPVTSCEMCGSPRYEHTLLGARLNRSQGRRPRSVSGISVSVKRCQRCDLIFSDPMPIPHDISDHYGRPAEDYWKESYFEYDENYFRSEIATAKRLLEFKPGMKALDIGAGIGKAMVSLDKSGFDTFGIEPSAPFREKAISRMGILPSKLQLASIESASLDAYSFDFISFGAVLEHLYSPSSAISKAISWLKPSGVIHIEVPSSNYLISKMLNMYFRLHGTTYVTNISPMHLPFHLYEFGIKSFEENSKIGNYEIIFHEFLVCLIQHIPNIFHPMLKAYMGRTNTGMQLSIWLRPSTGRLLKKYRA